MHAGAELSIFKNPGRILQSAKAFSGYTREIKEAFTAALFLY
jgi:hypothetical protein